MERTYRVNDVVDSEFLRLPLSLLANPKYKQMSLEAKFIYSLLLNRMTLSQRNGWVNENKEVYLIYTREEASKTLNISYKKAIAAFKELIQHGLLHEQRQGLGAPNLLYVLKTELTVEDAEEFGSNFDGQAPCEEPENPNNSQMCQNDTSRPVKTAHQELPNQHIKNCQQDISGTAALEGQDLPELHTSKTDNIKTDLSQIDLRKIEYSQSFNPSALQNNRTVPPVTDGQTDMIILQQLLGKCSLEMFSPNVSMMLAQAIERLYYSEYLKIGNAKLPRDKIRSYLWLLSADILITVLNAMKKNEGRIKNPMAYLMSTIINTICEQESSLLLSLPAECITTEDLYAPAAENYDEGDDTDGYLYTHGSASDFGPSGTVRGSP